MPVPPRAFASPRARGRNQADRTVLELLVRLCGGEIQSRCATKGRQMTDRDHRVHVISIGDGSARQNGCGSRNRAATRAPFLRFAVSLAFLTATAALDAGVTPNYQIQTRFLAEIAIACILISTLAACLKPFCREIILAAFLIMCNAAETFFPITFRILRTAQVSWRENKFFESLGGHRATKRIRCRARPGGESLVAPGRAPCFASLTFDGG